LSAGHPETSDRQALLSCKAHRCRPETQEIVMQCQQVGLYGFPTHIPKLGRTTNPSERLNHTLRQRGSRLVRVASSCPKKLAKQMGAIKLFICHDNLTRAAA